MTQAAAMTTGAATADAAIHLRDVSVHFGDITGLKEASFDIAPGEFVSVVGPSGCGKTTLLNLLTGLLPVQTGTVKVLGKPAREGNSDVAYMLARDCLLPWRTTLGNAMYGMEARGLLPGKEREKKAHHLLERVGLHGFADQYPKALSHGMRQRNALARTFCLDSPVLLMDEPFGALDAQTKLQREYLLLDLWREHQKTVVFITHDLGEAVALSDRVMVMSARPGRIVADIKIDLPRPRSVRDLQKSHEFHEIYTEVWEVLEAGMKS